MAKSSSLVSKGKVVNSKSTAAEVKKMANEENGNATTEKAAESTATKVLTLESVEAGIAEMITEGLLPEDVRGLIESGVIKAEIDQAEVEKGKYSGDYVRLSLGENCKTDEDAVVALVMISGGNLRAPMKEDGKTADLRKPSLEKFALYGADLNARSRVSQRVRAAAEGPEKAIERMADQLQKAKPGLSREKAVAKAKAMLEDDDE